MMTTESTLSKRPVSRIAVALAFLLKLFSSHVHSEVCNCVAIVYVVTVFFLVGLGAPRVIFCLLELKMLLLIIFPDQIRLLLIRRPTPALIRC